MDKTKIFIAGGFLIGVVIGYFFALFQYRTDLELLKGYSSAKNSPALTSVEGTIEKINGSLLTVQPVTPPGIVSNKIDPVEITLNEKTVILKNLSKDPKKLEEENATYQKKVKELNERAAALNLPPSALPKAPLPFEQKEIKQSDLREGNKVNIFLSLGELSGLKVAEKIIVQ